MTSSRLAVAVLVLTGAVLGGAGPVAALPMGVVFNRVDWTAWHDCWRPDDAPDNALMCLLPAEQPAAVRMVTVRNARVMDERVVHVDGVSRAVEEGGCRGSERAAWSADRRRIFLRTELDCGGIARVTTSVLALVGESQLLDARAVTVNGQHATHTMRYRPAPRGQVPAGVAMQLPEGRELARQTARQHAAAPLDADALVEAAAQLAPPALDALLAAGGTSFRVDARMLRRLEQGGVPGSALDVAIALAHPERFEVRSGTAEAAEPQPLRPRCDEYMWRFAPYDPACDPLYHGRWGFGYRNRYGYLGRFGYDSWWDPFFTGYGSAFWGAGRPVVIVVRDEEPARAPELVKGQGYTRGGAAQTGTAQPRSGTGAARPAAPPRGWETGGTSTSGSSTGTASGSSAATSSGGATGRTAVPRGG